MDFIVENKNNQPSLTQQDLEQIYSGISQQLNVLVHEQQQLAETIERLVNNRNVVGALIEIRMIQAQPKPKDETKPTMTPQEYEAYLTKQRQ